MIFENHLNKTVFLEISNSERAVRDYTTFPENG